MFTRRLWGRPPFAWVLDAAVVVIAVFLLLLGDPTLRLIAVLMLVWRAISVGLAVLVWRRSAEGRSQR